MMRMLVWFLKTGQHQNEMKIKSKVDSKHLNMMFHGKEACVVVFPTVLLVLVHGPLAPLF
jgi:hypothetical protein